jgi:hypothetical protein
VEPTPTNLGTVLAPGRDRPLNAVTQNAISALRHAGYAVVVFYPEELGDANPRRLEDRLCELGAECISDLQD